MAPAIDEPVRNSSMVRLITLLAALAALAIAATLPASCFLAAQARLRGEVEIQAQAYSRLVADEARQNPDVWNAMAGGGGLDPNSLRSVLGPSLDQPGVAERRQVLSASGRTVLDLTGAVAPLWPTLAIRLVVLEDESRLGEVEVARSLRPALIMTGLVACGSACLGLLMFVLLRVVPLRALAKAIDQASFLAMHDLLTGLPNRRLFHDRLLQATGQARRDSSRVAVFYLDLDHFKSINDLLGHPAGDATLQVLAERLRGCLRPGDTLARLGGDEFAVIQPMLRHGEHAAVDAQALGRRLLAAADDPIDLDGHALQAGLSVGVTVSDAGVPLQPTQLMKQADIALYEAKEAGRGRLRFFEPAMSIRLRQRQAMEADLRQAVCTHALVLHFQPQVDLATGNVFGAEALLRWNRPGHGLVPPDEFIGLAEASGLIVPIGLWVLREACLRAVTWPSGIGIAVNVSPVQMRHEGFCQAVIDTIGETGLDPGRLELEITEGVLMQDTDETLAILQRLRDHGIRLAMDDFGTGYSSLGYLQKFRFDKIKIDRSFVSRLGQDPNADAIVRAVVGMSEALGVRTIAEGVETSSQASELRAHGCPEAQGYLYSRPIDGDAFAALVAEGVFPAPPPLQPEPLLHHLAVLLS